MADQTYDKIDLATEQLDNAIPLFLERQFASALPLARAAEEVLSKALSHRGKQDSVEWKREASNPFIHFCMEGRYREKSSSKRKTTHCSP